MGVLPNLISAREALFAYVNSPVCDMRKLRAIRQMDRSTPGSMDRGIGGPDFATSWSAAEPSRKVGPTSRLGLARHNRAAENS
jgi:hypothetical protein